MTLHNTHNENVNLYEQKFVTIIFFNIKKHTYKYL